MVSCILYLLLAWLKRNLFGFVCGEDREAFLTVITVTVYWFWLRVPGLLWAWLSIVFSAVLAPCDQPRPRLKTNSSRGQAALVPRSSGHPWLDQAENAALSLVSRDTGQCGRPCDQILRAQRLQASRNILLKAASLIRENLLVKSDAQDFKFLSSPLMLRISSSLLFHRTDVTRRQASWQLWRCGQRESFVQID